MLVYSYNYIMCFFCVSISIDPVFAVLFYQAYISTLSVRKISKMVF